MHHASKQWSEVKALDEPKHETNDTEAVDKNHVIITCSSCNQRFKIRKNLGIVKAKCPHCQGVYRVMT